MNPHEHVREQFAASFLSRVGFADIAHLFVKRTDIVLSLSDRDKQLLARHVAEEERLEITRSLWQSAVHESVSLALNDYVHYRSSQFESADILIFLYLIDAHLEANELASEALIRDTVGRIVRHLLVFYDFGQLQLLTSHLLTRSLQNGLAGTLLSATKTSTRVARHMLNTALGAKSGRDYYLTLIRCYPFCTAAINLCSFVADNASGALNEQHLKSCSQERKPFREVRDHTSGWIALTLALSDGDMDFMIKHYHDEVRSTAATDGLDAALREAIFRCKTRHEVPIFAMNEVMASLRAGVSDHE